MRFGLEFGFKSSIAPSDVGSDRLAVPGRGSQGIVDSLVLGPFFNARVFGIQLGGGVRGKELRG